MRQVSIFHFAVLIALVTAVTLCSRSDSENSKFEHDDSTYRQSNLSQTYCRDKRSAETKNFGRFTSATKQTIEDLTKIIDEKEETLKLLSQSNSAQDLDYKSMQEEVIMLQEVRKKLTSKHFKDTLITGTNSKNLDAVFHEDRKLFTDAIRKTIHDLYGTMDLKFILNFVDGFKYYGQSIEGYAAIFLEIKETSWLYDEDMLELASHIHKKYKHGIGSVEDKKTIEMLNDGLPTSMSALAFSADNLYIKNNYFNQFLEAYSSTRFRGLDIEFGKIGSWRLEKHGDNWNIKNNNNNEFMFYSTDRSWYPYLTNLRTSYTDNVNTEWIIVLKPNGVQFKHKHLGKFLCVDKESNNTRDYWYHDLALWETVEQKWMEWCTWEMMSSESRMQKKNSGKY